MSFLHAFFTQSNHQWNFWPKLIKLCFDGNCNFKDSLYVSFLEKSDNTCKNTNAILNKFFCSWGIKRLPFAMHPFLNVCKPIMTSNPKIRIRSKLFYHIADFIVVCCVHSKEIFSGVEFSCFILQSCQTFIDLYTTFAYIFMFVNILI